MKELIHFTMTGSTVCKEMKPIIDKFIAENPDVVYSKVVVDLDNRLFSYYDKKYGISICPTFLGLRDGVLQDGHVGLASQMVLEALVN